MEATKPSSAKRIGMPCVPDKLKITTRSECLKNWLQKAATLRRSRVEWQRWHESRCTSESRSSDAPSWYRIQDVAPLRQMPREDCRLTREWEWQSTTHSHRNCSSMNDRDPEPAGACAFPHQSHPRCAQSCRQIPVQGNNQRRRKLAAR